MNVKSAVKKGLLAVFFLALLLFINVGAIFGVPLPHPLVTEQYGSYQLAAFETGLALYQTGSQTHFYSFSPLNDFYLTEEGQRSALLSIEDYEAKNFQTNLNPPLPYQYLQAIKAYFGQESLVFELQTDWKVTYVVVPQNDGFVINQVTQPPINTDLVSLGSTVKLAEEDIIFSDKQTESADRQRISNGRISIQNPSMPGFITIIAAPNQTMWLDTNTNLVELVTPISSLGPTYQTTITIEINNQTSP